ncbi:MAG: hydroxymethylglutaryl-CoA synthase [Candidatus Aenigmatarchaeota archaeon]
MVWTGPGYRRTLDLRYLKGKECEKCGNLYFSTRNYCGDCGRDGELKEVKLPREGVVHSSSVVRKSTNSFQLNKDVPYSVGAIKLKGMDFKIPAIIDSEERLTGEDVRAEIGLLGESNDIKFHSYIWRKKRRYHQPEPQRGECDVKEGFGILDYGVYVPRKRIKSEEIAEIWGEKVSGMVKSFPGKWDDPAAYAMNSALNCLETNSVPSEDIEKIMVGSESHPYAVKPTASIVAELIGSSGQAVDFEFACKAGTQAVIDAYDSVKAGSIDYGMAIGADSSQARPGDALKYMAADGGAAYLVGREDPIAVINGYESFTSDTPDFLRKEAEEFPVHFGRYTGEPAYFKHIIESSRRLMESQGTEPEDYDYAVFHQPNMKFPRRVGKRLGFSKHQIEPGIVVDWIGNTYSACTLLGLARVLDQASPGERIFVASYGSGAGSDAFDITVTERITVKQEEKKRSVDSWIGKEDKELLEFGSYGEYAKNKGLLKD